MTRVLLTGASGFVGSHVLRHLMEETDWDVVCLASFRHHGASARMTSAMDGYDWSRVSVVMHDLSGPLSAVELFQIGDVDYVLNVASESHVERSIEHPVPFIENNVSLMLNLLEGVRKLGPEKVIQVSTDEVYGPADADVYPNGHPEWSPIIPSNPYSASKAAQEAIAISYWRTYSVPVIITNTMNLIGEMQDPEKFVPKTIQYVLDGRPMTVHVGADGVAGSRFYLHARNQADALLYILRNVEPAMYPNEQVPTRLNVVGEIEVRNDELVEYIASVMARDVDIERVQFHASRPGHDLRYGLDGSQLAELGWKAPVPLWASLEKSIEWTLDHPEWLLGG